MKSGSKDFSLPVKIWGTDRDGANFSETAYAQEFGECDALLAGINCYPQPGDTIGIQFEENSARARIVWLLEGSASQTPKIRIHLLDPTACPWRSVLSMRDQRDPPAHERRRCPRYRIPVPLELRQKPGGAPLHASTSDISAGGCYVETLLPLAVGTKLDIGIWLGSDKLSSEGIVRTCDPAVGMGIEFQELTGEEIQRLEQFLQAKCRLRGPTQGREDPSAKTQEVKEHSAHRAAGGSSN